VVGGIGDVKGYVFKLTVYLSLSVHLSVRLCVSLSVCHLPGSESGMNGGGFQTLHNISNDIQHFNKNGKFKNKPHWPALLLTDSLSVPPLPKPYPHIYSIFQ